MRIGILTLPLHTNYGGILQAYALQTVLQHLGHEVFVITVPDKKILYWWKWGIVYPKRIIRKYIFHKEIRIFIEQYCNKTAPVVRRNVDLFILQYINRLQVKKLSDLKQCKLDAIIVGSDQVWRPLYLPYKIEDAYLKFARKWDIKRVAYAVSFGVDDWEYTSKQTKLCKKLVQLFNGVSIREESGLKLCNEYLSVNADFVLDPTMLLTADDYCKLFVRAKVPKSKGTLLNYTLDETLEKRLLVQAIAKDRKLIPFHVNSKVEDLGASIEERIQPSVEQWLRGFYDAEFVVTDSFHACVFSILFKKQFVVCGNMERGLARFLSLLHLFGLEDRLVFSVDDLVGLNEIDYECVYEKLIVVNKQSLCFLENNV